MSQSPLLSHDSAAPIASVPDEQAFTTVSAGPRALILPGKVFSEVPFQEPVSTGTIDEEPCSRYEAIERQIVQLTCDGRTHAYPDAKTANNLIKSARRESA